MSSLCARGDGGRVGGGPFALMWPAGWLAQWGASSCAGEVAAGMLLKNYRVWDVSVERSVAFGQALGATSGESLAREAAKHPVHFWPLGSCGTAGIINAQPGRQHFADLQSRSDGIVSAV